MIYKELSVGDWFFEIYCSDGEVWIDEILGELESIGYDDVDPEMFLGNNWSYTFVNDSLKIVLIIIGPTK